MIPLTAPDFWVVAVETQNGETASSEPSIHLPSLVLSSGQKTSSFEFMVLAQAPESAWVTADMAGKATKDRNSVHSRPNPLNMAGEVETHAV
jgi:hypothetical protein